MTIIFLFFFWRRWLQHGNYNAIVIIVLPPALVICRWWFSMLNSGIAELKSSWLALACTAQASQCSPAGSVVCNIGIAAHAANITLLLGGVMTQSASRWRCGERSKIALTPFAASTRQPEQPPCCRSWGSALITAKPPSTLCNSRAL